MYDVVPPTLRTRSSERRLAQRFCINTPMNHYVGDDAYEAVAVDVSETGLALKRASLQAVRTPARVIGVEVELPGTGEIIWASAEPRLRAADPGWAASGLHFVAMARKHERLLRDYVRERHERWQRLFAPRPIYVSRFGCAFS
jgi:hypothetical protein